MPRKSTAKPKPGELISFADLKAARDTKRAQYVCTVYAFDHSEPVRAGDIVLCELNAGARSLKWIPSAMVRCSPSAPIT
jgi:hypothetical protein